MVESFTPQNLQEVLNVNNEVFKLELAHCVTVKTKLFVQEETIPKFCKPHKLPLALKPVVGMSWTN